jgi:hypothetical protein
MTILDDQFFGTPLLLAHWLHNMSNGLPIAEKILNIVWNEHQKQLNESDAMSKSFKLILTINNIKIISEFDLIIDVFG